MYKILLATDGSEYSLQSLQKIIPMAKAMQAKLTVLSVAEEIPFLRGTEGMSQEEFNVLVNSINREAEMGLERARKLFESAGLKVETMLRAGKSAEVICEEAENGSFDLIVLGDTGRGGLKELFLGSVSNKIVHQARTDVMIVKRKN